MPKTSFQSQASPAERNSGRRARKDPCWEQLSLRRLLDEQMIWFNKIKMAAKSAHISDKGCSSQFEEMLYQADVWAALIHLHPSNMQPVSNPPFYSKQ